MIFCPHTPYAALERHTIAKFRLMTEKWFGRYRGKLTGKETRNFSCNKFCSDKGRNYTCARLLDIKGARFCRSSFDDQRFSFQKRKVPVLPNLHSLCVCQELNVVDESLVHVYPFGSCGDKFVANIEFVPTVQHCSLAPLIGKSCHLQSENLFLHFFLFRCVVGSCLMLRK